MMLPAPEVQRRPVVLFWPEKNEFFFQETRKCAVDIWIGFALHKHECYYVVRGNESGPAHVVIFHVVNL